MTALKVTTPGVTQPATTLPATMLPESTLADITLREMTWRDIPALSALEPVLFADDPWSPQTWWAELAGRPNF